MTSAATQIVGQDNPKDSSQMKTQTDTPSKAKRVITGREVLTDYFKGDAVATITYRKICNAIDIVPKWEKAAKIQFLEQFLNISDILDNRCKDLVANLARLSWQAIPEEIMDRYLNMLCDVAIRQVTHTDVIYAAAVQNLVPVVKVNDVNGAAELALSTEEQDKYYSFAHRIIVQVLKSFPMSDKLLLKAMRSGVPHISQDRWRFIGYMRNMLQCLEYVGSLRVDVWELIIDQMIVCDNMLTKSETGDDKKLAGDAAIFAMDEDQDRQIENDENETTAKLDGLTWDVLRYISLKHGIGLDTSSDATLLRFSGGSGGEEVFASLLSLLKSRMLLSVHVRYTSFLWLYICSLRANYGTQTLETLWSVIVSPQIAQADVAKSHGAAAYLAAFLARAKYLDTATAVSWMSRIVNWCIQYIDSCGIAKQISPGMIRHGTFYSLCQAFFIVFSFRYREMVKSGEIEHIRRWGLGRIVHSPLDPLKFVVRPVGLCFAAISRSLQLVYCNHLLPFDAGTKLPFEPMFPFDTYKLRSSSSVICPLLRGFSPLAEDKSEVTSVLKSSRINETTNEETMDFLDDEDAIMGSYGGRPDGIIQCSNQPSMFTIYSSSPGLKHFESLSTSFQ
ncbi:hypothetical protein Q1695_015273 [Nippostrongylus brasiliensis]|nr:hypothetical protein Q1695_015273 [Nippostrongylus brasiliensis]